MANTNIRCLDMTDDQRISWLYAHLDLYSQLVGIKADSVPNSDFVPDEEYCNLAWAYTKDIFNSIHRLLHIKFLDQMPADSLTRLEMDAIEDEGWNYTSERLRTLQLLYCVNLYYTSPAWTTQFPISYGLDTRSSMDMGHRLTQQLNEHIVSVTRDKEFTKGKTDAEMEGSPFLAGVFQSLAGREPAWSLINPQRKFHKNEAKVTVFLAALLTAREARMIMTCYPLTGTLQDSHRDLYSNWDKVAIKPVTDELEEVLALDKETRAKLYVNYPELQKSM